MNSGYGLSLYLQQNPCCKLYSDLLTVTSGINFLGKLNVLGRSEGCKKLMGNSAVQTGFVKC